MKTLATAHGPPWFVTSAKPSSKAAHASDAHVKYRTGVDIPLTLHHKASRGVDCCTRDSRIMVEEYASFALNTTS